MKRKLQGKLLKIEKVKSCGIMLTSLDRGENKMLEHKLYDAIGNMMNESHSIELLEWNLQKTQ